MNIILGVTGSVAAKLTKKMVEELQERGHDVKVILTRSAEYFVPKKCLYVQVYDQYSEWPKERYENGDEILHIELTKWADAFIIAPLTANTAAKLANGISDNLLTCVYSAWDRKKQIILAPAMNTKMWYSPAVGRNMNRLLGDCQACNMCIVDPVYKELACGETGIGAMADIKDIISKIKRRN